MRLGCGLLSITTPVSHLANEFDVRSILHGQVSFAAVNQICVIHETMNGCKNLMIHSKCKYSLDILLTYHGIYKYQAHSLSA